MVGSSNKSKLGRCQTSKANAKREVRRPILQKVKKLEDQLTKLEKEMAAIEHELTDLSLYEENNKVKLQTYLSKQVQIKKELDRVEEEWLNACEERDKLT